MVIPKKKVRVKSLKLRGRHPSMANPLKMKQVLQQNGILASNAFKQGHDMVISFNSERDKEAFKSAMNDIFNGSLSLVGYKPQNQESLKPTINPKPLIQASFPNIRSSQQTRKIPQRRPDSDFIWVNPNLAPPKKREERPKAKQLEIQYESEQDEEEVEDAQDSQEEYEEEHEEEVSRRSALRSWDEDEPIEYEQSPAKRDYMKEMSFESIREDTKGENEQSDEHGALGKPYQMRKKKRLVVKESTLRKYSAKKQEEKRTETKTLVVQKKKIPWKPIRQSSAGAVQIPPVIEIHNIPREPKAKCFKMCPEAEAHLREETHDLSIFEKQKNDSHKVNLALAVKKYARSAADRKMDDPQTIRPPSILRQTVNYLVNCVLDADSEQHQEYLHQANNEGHSLELILPFVLDRLRAVQQDFSIIGKADLVYSEGEDFVFCHETSVKIQLMFANEALEVSNEAFDPARNYKQMVATLSALRDRYATIKQLNEESIALQNETEFLSYLLFLQMDQPLQIASMLMTMSTYQISSPSVSQALKVLDAFSNDQPFQWFQHFKSLPYLCSCAMIPYLVRMRQLLLNQVLRGEQGTQQKLNGWSKQEFIDLFCFESEEEAQEFLKNEGHEIIEKQTGKIILGEIAKDPNFIYRPHANFQYIENKRIKDGIYKLRREVLNEVKEAQDKSTSRYSLDSIIQVKQASSQSEEDLSPAANNQPQLRRRETSVELPQFFIQNGMRS